MLSFKRNIFLHQNKFQSKILFYLACLSFASMMLMILFLAYLYSDIENFLHTYQFFTIKTCILTALPITAVLTFTVCIYLFYLTSKIFGPYERLLKEMDHLLESNEKKELKTRKGDEMFEELAKRINALIHRLP